MELMQANAQWRIRPPDERFKSIQALHNACSAVRENTFRAHVTTDDITVDMSGNDMLLRAQQCTAKLNNWSFNQLCTKVGVPAGYVRTLPIKLTHDNIAHGLNTLPAGTPLAAHLMRDKSSAELPTLRALTSEKYATIYNSDITSRLLDFQQSNPGWKNPLAYSITTGELEPGGLYASDHDMFAFLVDESKSFEGSPQGLNRGFFCWNSEVGAKSFGVMTFYYNRVCGNNIVWGASNVTEMRLRHVGAAEYRAFSGFSAVVKKYADSSGNELEAAVKKAKMIMLGNDKESVLDAFFRLPKKLQRPELTKARISDAVDTAERRVDRYGEPYSLWALISGLTENSQKIMHADEKNKIDLAAGKLLTIAGA